MGFLEAAIAQLTDVSTVLDSMSDELDVIKAKIDALPAGEVVTQEQKDALAASVQALADKVTSVKTKEDAVAA